MTFRDTSPYGPVTPTASKTVPVLRARLREVLAHRYQLWNDMVPEMNDKVDQSLNLASGCAINHAYLS